MVPISGSGDYDPYDFFYIDYTESGKEHRQPLEHFHDTYELALFIRADIDIFVKDTKYHIEDGDLLLINPYDIHSIFYNPEHDYTRYVLQFKHSFVQELLQVLGLEGMLEAIGRRRNKKISLDLPQRVKLEGLYRTILHLWQQLQQPSSQSIHHSKDASLEPSLKLHITLLLLEYSKLSSSPSTVRRVRQRQADGQVREIIGYLDEHYMEPVQLNDLELRFGKSKYTICHMFSQTTQFTIVEYLQYRRIIEAQKRLTQTDQSIIDIALDFGFQNVQHFYRTFKKISNKTPLQYRKEAQANKTSSR